LNSERDVREEVTACPLARCIDHRNLKSNKLISLRIVASRLAVSVCHCLGFPVLKSRASQAGGSSGGACHIPKSPLVQLNRYPWYKDCVPRKSICTSYVFCPGRPALVLGGSRLSDHTGTCPLPNHTGTYPWVGERNAKPRLGCASHIILCMLPSWWLGMMHI
jgi:hypothetical protein